MPILPENPPLFSFAGRRLFSLVDINVLARDEKEQIYSRLIPSRLFSILAGNSADTRSHTTIIAPEGMSLARIEVKLKPDDRSIFFLDIAETHFHQMELSFCIINDPFAPRFNVDVDIYGNNNCFATMGRNIPEEIRAMNAGLFPNQTSRGLRMFGEFFHGFEFFVDSMDMEMITAEPLTYDNAVRFEKYGFDYLSGRRMMMEIDREFRPGGILFSRLDGSTPFRQPGMERTVHGRSWAIHDGILDRPRDDSTHNDILDEPWENIRIYRMVGRPAKVCTFTETN
jgi:hypothetical protein